MRDNLSGQSSRKPYEVEAHKVFTFMQEFQYYLLIGFWVVVNCYFWFWWLRPDNVGNPYLFVAVSFAFLYDTTVLPSFYLFYLGQMRKPQMIPVERAQDAGVIKKVALITTTVPGSENIEIVKRQLIAMANVRFPHDSWVVVDKVHSPEIKTLAESLGVNYFSRKDVETYGKANFDKWNAKIPPFKTGTKAGNVNSWLDAFGDRYSHFTQLDIDHIPNPEYLDKVLGFFLDPKVAWVQAPSVYGNLEHWTARGSAEQEFGLQGPMQMGFFGFCKTPFIIGSHCTYDVSAIKKIGGFQPTRAEDHLDTVFLAAEGKQGVFLPEVIAVGDGPENFETYLAQQFAWAYSMIQVLFNYTPRCLKNYNHRQALQFLFVQTWYTLSSTTLFILFAIPLAALLLNKPISNTGYLDFISHSILIAIAGFVIYFWSRRWHLPKNLQLSWRGIILHIARWPIVLSAFVQVLLKIEKPYMITVKGLDREVSKPFNLTQHLPYFILIGSSLIASWYYMLVIDQSQIQGYLLFALQGSFITLLVYIADLAKNIKDMRGEGTSLFRIIQLRLKPIFVFFITIYLLGLTTVKSSGRIEEAVFYIPDNIIIDLQDVNSSGLVDSGIKFTIGSYGEVAWLKSPEYHYTVKAGDTLSRIATTYYKDQTKWEEISIANSLDDDAYIHAGDVLILPN